MGRYLGKANDGRAGKGMSRETPSPFDDFHFDVEGSDNPRLFGPQ
jgi:hypothetical protein